MRLYYWVKRLLARREQIKKTYGTPNDCACDHHFNNQGLG